METLASKSAGKQIERSKSGYKPSKIAQKMFADLFGDSGAIGLYSFMVPPAKIYREEAVRIGTPPDIA